MTYDEVNEFFERCILPNLPPDDDIWHREAWNNYTDMLCKDGHITEDEYNTWDNPY
jgi:hypothetical protein